MTQAPAPTDPRSQAPLLQQLTRLGLLASRAPANVNLAEMLGNEIDLADSIALASSLSSLERVRPAGNVSLEKPQRQFLNTRGVILRLIANTFEPGDTPVPFTLPAPSAETLSDPAEGVKPFQRFYSLQQSEMDHRITGLRRSLRGSLGYEGPLLTRLAALDRILDDTLGEYSRRVLASLPKLLGEHFTQRREAFLQSAQATQHTQPADWVKPDGWLHAFYQDMQQLLLAELDFRLLPARALLDALLDATPDTLDDVRHKAKATQEPS